jgi:hypothetical protein
MTIAKVAVGSAAKVTATLNTGFGLIFGFSIAAVSMLGSGLASAMPSEGAPPVLGAFFGVGAIIFLPLLYGFFGLIGGAVGAIIYNMAAGIVGGLEIETR